MFKRAPFILLALTCAGFAVAQKWSFVVTGDGRTDPRNAAVAADSDGINKKAWLAVLEAIKKENPKFLVFTGDLVNGENPAIKSKLPQQFEAWLSIWKSAPGITLLPVRGNHETYGEDKVGSTWLKYLKPVIDQAGVSYLPGEEGFSYSYTPSFDPTVMFIAMDQYINPHKVNLVELEKRLQEGQAKGVKHVFVYAHEMAFTAVAHPDRNNMAAFPEDRDKFVHMMQKYNVKYFFCGHDHSYDYMTVKHPSWPETFEWHQVIAGTAGAPFYEDKGYIGNNSDFKLFRREHLNATYGYVLVEVDGDKVTARFKAVYP